MCHLPVCAMVRLLFVRAMLSDRVEHGCANLPDCIVYGVPLLIVDCTVRLLTELSRDKRDV